MTQDNQPPPRARGCLIYGLVTAILVFIGVIAGIYFGTRKAVRYAIETYTTNAPVAIPVLQVQPARQRVIANGLVQRFEQAANNRGTNEMSLGEDELNILVAQSPDLKVYQHRVYLEPEGSELKVSISMPLDQFKPWQEFAYKMGGTNYAGRYLNGVAYTQVVVTNGLLKIQPHKMVVSGKALPDDFLTKFPWDTLIQPINQNTNLRAALQQVDNISVQDGKLQVVFKH